ncbi:DUF1232 domain-containing protein [Klebsiella pneumoniae]
MAYFISPIDAIPDVLPMGLTDDIAVLSAALASIAAFIDEQIRARTARKMRELFGQD